MNKALISSEKNIYFSILAGGSYNNCQILIYLLINFHHYKVLSTLSTNAIVDQVHKWC